MRIERTGSVARLTPRLQRFLVEALRGEDLDEIQHAEERKADFRCLGGLLVVELKTLEDDGSERIDNLTDELRERPDWPIFIGSAPMQSFIAHLEGAEDVKRQFVNRIGRAIRQHLRKANKQLAAHEIAFPRKNLVKVMLLANEDHEIYDPEMVGYIVQHLLSRTDDGQRLYPNVDAVLFFSERHAARIHGNIAFPIVCVEGFSIEDASWKRDVVDLAMSRWSNWNGVPLFHSTPADQKFSTIDHVPESMKRYEKWELDYKRNRYMRDFTKEQVRERFDEVICISSLAFLKDSPFKPDKDAVTWSMSSMSHLMLEMGWRSIPVTEFQYTPERLAAAARRMKLPGEVVVWYELDVGRAA